MASTHDQPYSGPNRRRYDRSLASAPKVIGRARFIDRSTPKREPPAGPRWYPVMDRGHGTELRARPGFVWLGVDGAERQVELIRLEVDLQGKPGAGG